MDPDLKMIYIRLKTKHLESKWMMIHFDVTSAGRVIEFYGSFGVTRTILK